MSATYGTQLRSSLLARDSPATVALIEPRIRSGHATQSEALLCGVLLLMPPLVDEAAAALVFAGLLSGERRFEAAVWDAYRYAILVPDGEQLFMPLLLGAETSAISAYIQSLVASAHGDTPKAIAENRRSVELRPFPFNLMRLLELNPDTPMNEKTAIWEMICDLVVDRSVEKAANAATVEGALQRHWENLIEGTRLTSPLWASCCEMWGPLAIHEPRNSAGAL